MSATEEERCYPIRKAAQAQLSAPFHEGSLAHMPLEWKPDLKGSQGLPAGYYSDICGQSSASSVFGPAHKWLHTKKISLLTDRCPVKSTICFRACWALGKLVWSSSFT